MPAKKCVGYQIIQRAGRGSGFQKARLSVVESHYILSIRHSLLFKTRSHKLKYQWPWGFSCFPKHYPAHYFSHSDMIFSACLKPLIPKDAPNVDPQVINPKSSLLLVLLAYGMLSGVKVCLECSKRRAWNLDHVFYMLLRREQFV
jgi:hypothetical protein